MKGSKLFVVWAVVLVVSALLGAGGAFASHRWGCWKYADYYINWYNGGSGDYYNIYNEEAKTDSNAWSPYTDIFLNPSSSGTTDHVNAYSGNYGSTGWLGIAEIQGYSGCTIRNGRARLNNSYLASYSRTAKKHVACQEIGHLFGLDHNRGSSTTCMNDQILTAPQPNSHDQSMINSLY